MKACIFGTDLENPPYKASLIDGHLSLKTLINNWKQTKVNKEIYNRYFNYYEYPDGKGGTWYMRIDNELTQRLRKLK